MGYAKFLRKLFPGLTIRVEDMLLLEDFQVKYLPDRVPAKEFSVLLRAHPVVQQFLELKYAPIEDFINTILRDHPPAENENIIEESCQNLLWEIADLIIYNKFPEVYDQSGLIWELSELSTITSLEGKIVIDAGAGTGKLAFLVAPVVDIVYAMEPVGNMRRFIREKAARTDVKNIFAIDGFLDSIPLPDKSLDVLMTSNAIGWNLEDELKEIERVLRPGGYAIHLLKSDDMVENPYHDLLTSAFWNYSCVRSDIDRGKVKYFKAVKHDGH